MEKWWKRNKGNKSNKNKIRYAGSRYVYDWNDLKEVLSLALLLGALIGWPVFSLIFWMLGHSFFGPFSLICSILGAYVLYRGLTK
ncbi:hypothetical protein [Paenibacillus medicaginis]|uniref:AtpZ/AtpI family protein n=1 Tax=Paenibacillus medicaginis TaxID=1470560 RepID=A0ABV5C2C7_9BACL